MGSSPFLLVPKRTRDATIGFQGSNDSIAHKHGSFRYKIVERVRPRAVASEGLVKLGCQGVELGKAPPRNVHKVVVLHVIAHVEGDPVQGTVVAVGFLPFEEDPVFVDKVRHDEMKRMAKQSTQQKVGHCRRAQGSLNQQGEDGLGEDIDRFVAADTCNERTASGYVDKGVEQQPSKLAPSVVGNPLDFDSMGQVCITGEDTQESMMGDVVSMKGGCRRNDHGKIGKECQELVVKTFLEGQVGSGFVDGLA